MWKRQRWLFLLLLSPLLLYAKAPSSTLNACYANWEPYSYHSKQNGLSGFSIEIYKAALKRAGLSVNFTELPWSRCKRSVEQGKIDMAVDGGPRMKNTLVNPKRPIPWVLVLWTNQPHTSIKEIEIQNKPDIAFVESYGYPLGFLERSSQQFIPVTNDLEGLRMLHHNRFHYFYGDLINGNYLKSKHQLAIQPLLPALNITLLDLTFHQSKHKEQALYQAALEALYQDGSINRIYKKYLGSHYQAIMTLMKN